MDIARKLEIVKTSIDSISTHTDADAALRQGALKAVQMHCQEESAKIDADLKTQIDALSEKKPEVTSEDDL